MTGDADTRRSALVDWTALNCPHCHSGKRSRWARITGTAHHPVVCPACGCRSVPGPVPASEVLRFACTAPLLLAMFLGLRYLSFGAWVSSVVVVLPLTFVAVVWLQLRMPLTPASDDQVAAGRTCNNLLGMGLGAAVVLFWLL